jgi:hypothetical protein
MMRRASCLTLLLALAACGPHSFQSQFKAPEATNERVVLAEISAQKARDERPVAVGISGDGARLFAWDLSAGLLWERPIHAKSGPLVVADAIVMREQDGIVVRDLASGEVRVVVDEEGQLIGADGQGRALVIAIGYADNADPRARVVYVEGDSVKWKQPLKLPVGVPALAGRYVIVPWATQRVSVLAAQNGGVELARWHFAKTVVGHALVDHGHVYVGQHGLMRLDQQTIEHAAQASSVYAPAGRALPGQPPVMRDGYLPVPEPENAYHRVRSDWRVSAADGPIAAENDLLVARFYRMLFALAAGSDDVRWVRTFDHDLVGSAIQPGGLFVADNAGMLRFIDNGGVTRMQRDLGRPLQMLAIRPGAWVPAPSTDAAAKPGETPAGSLREQLFAAAALEDDRLTAGRGFAIEHLARNDEAAVTANLIALCSATKSPAPLQLAACAYLSKRTSGGDSVIEAMRRHASFLEDADPPPVGALAQAAAGMQLKKAGPLLVAHVEDPNTSARDLPVLFDALEKLNHKGASSAIERFVRLHHAEPEGSEAAPALYAALHAIGTLRVKSARPSLQNIEGDALTPNGVRDKAREALALLDAPPAPPVSSKPEPEPKAEPVEEAQEGDDTQTDPRPYALSAEMVRASLQPVQKALSQCLAADATRPRSARVSMVVQGEGRVEGIFVVPTTLQACVEPLVREAKFPATRLGRQRVMHVVFGPNATAQDVKRNKPAAAAKPAKAKAPTPAKPAAVKTP